MKQKLPLIPPHCCQCRTVASVEFYCLQTPGLTYHNRLPLLVYSLDTLGIYRLPIDTQVNRQGKYTITYTIFLLSGVKIQWLAW